MSQHSRSPVEDFRVEIKKGNECRAAFAWHFQSYARGVLDMICEYYFARHFDCSAPRPHPLQKQVLIVLNEAVASCPNLTSLQPIHQKEMSWNSALPLENQSEICPMSFLPPPCPSVGAQAQYLWEAKREMLGPKRCRRRREPLSSVSRTSEEIYGTKQ